MKVARNALLALAFMVPAVAFAAIGVNKTFNPTNVSVGQMSTLTVILINNNPGAATGAAFTDNLPGSVIIATPANASTTCVGGTVTATPGATSFSLSGGTIPAAAGPVAGQCTAQVDVLSPVAGVFINTIPANAATSSQGNNSQAASATLTVAALVAITGAKTFLPTNLHGNGNPSTVTITLTNPNGVALTNTAFTDNLPVGLVIAPTPNASTTCLPNGAVTAGAGATLASLATGTIPAAVGGVAGTCTVKFDVVASAPNNFVNGTVNNAIPANAVTTAPVLPPSPAFARTVNLQTAASMTKAFAPTPIATGGISTLTITINNFNASAISPLDFIDNLPVSGADSVRVAPTPNVTTSASCNAPAVTAVAGAASITVTGGSLNGVAAGAGVSNTTCIITVDVTATDTLANGNPITFVNTIAAGLFGTVNHGAASGNLVVNHPTSITASKAFVPNAVVQGGTSTLTITINNANALVATLTAIFTDNLLASMGAGYAVAAAPAASTTCGGVLNAPPAATSFTLPIGTTIPAAGSCTITVPIQVAPNAVTGGRTNTIAQNVLQTDRGRTQSAITAILTTTAALTATKAYLPLTVQAGADSRLTVTLTHANGAPAFTGLAFTDNLPAGHTVSATPNPVTTCVLGTVTAVGGAPSFSLAGGTLALGATSCTVAVNIKSPAGAGSVANNIPIGGVLTAEGFVNPAVATSTLTRVVTNVTLNKSFFPATVLVGAVSRMTINVLNTNAGSLALTTTSLTDVLPLGMVIAPVPPNPAPTNSCGGVLTATPGTSTISIANGSIAAGATCAIAVTVVANASGNLINTLAAGAFASAQGVTNPLAAQATLAATGSADLQVTKTDGVLTVVPGTATTYTIVAKNNGPQDVAGAGFVDTPPAGMTFTGWTCVASALSSCGNLSGSGPINELITLVVNGTATYTVTAAIAANATGTITNTATVIVPGTVIDTNLANNTASDTDTLVPTADLSITKTDGVTTVIPGQSTTYTIVVSNAGPSSVTGATVADAFPAAITGASFTAVATGGATGFTAVGSGNIADTVNMPVGSTITYTVVANIAANALGTLTNTATVAAPGGVTDPTPGNNSATDSDTLVPTADLSITKTDGTATAVPGSTTTYTIVVFNAGPSSVAGATVTDLFPGAITSDTFTAVATGGATGFTASSSGNINDTVNMPVGSRITYTVVANISASATGTLVNTATVTPPGGVTDPTLGNNSATDTDTLSATADLSITKTDGVTTAVPGSTTTYTIVVTNNGPSNVTGATVSDAIPVAITSDTFTATATGGATGFSVSGVGSINDTVNMPVGSKITYIVVAQISASATGTLVNTATVTAPPTVTDPTPINNSATDTDTLSTTADLSITKTDGVATVVPGTSTTYTIVVTNAGPSSVTGATITDTMPVAIASDTFTAVATGGATGFTASSSGNINDTVNMPVGSTITYTVVAQISASATGTLANTAVVTVPGGVTDPTPGNNSATDTDTLSATADLSITKTDGVISVVPGTATTYTIVVTNNGPSNVTGATIVDAMPLSIASDTFNAIATGGATGFTVSGVGSINDTVNMPVGSKITYTVVANISASATGTLANTATVTAPPTVTDPTPGNNSATDTDTLTPQADLAISKTDGVTTLVPGNATTYTIVVSNIGPSNADGAIFKDAAVANLAVSAVTCGSVSGGAVCPTVPNTTIALMQGAGIVVPTLPLGGSVTFTVTATVASGATGSIANTATVTAPAGVTDPTPGNNTATDTDTLTPQADLAISKTDGVASIVPGTSTTYTIVVSNAGPSSADGTLFRDPVVANLTVTNVTCGSASGGAACPTVPNTTIALMQGAGIVVPTLPVGGSVTFTVVAAVSSGATGTLTNSATVTPPGGTTDPTPGNNSASDTDTLTPQADLAVTKTDGVAMVTAGGATTYTIVVNNAGPSNADGSLFKDPSVANLSVTSVTCGSAGGGAVCPTVPNTTIALMQGAGIVVPTLPTGGSVTFTVNATIASSATVSIANTATVTAPAGVTDPTPGNNTATDIDTITLTADLSITKTDGVATVIPGTSTAYTIVVANAGPSNVTGATVADVIPAAISSHTFTAVATGGATGFTASGSANINDTVNMPAGSTITYTIIANISATATGTLVNTATVTAPGGVTDPTPGNNSATDTDTLTPQADLAISKTDGVASVNAGGATTYTIVVNNIGPSNADGAVFKDAAVANLTVSGVTCGSASGGAACPTVPNTTVVLMQGAGIVVPALPSGGSVTFTVSATVLSGATGSITNVATVTAPAGVTDPTPGNNTATDIDIITLSADLAITKTDGVTTLVPGTATTYTIVVSNIGPSNADNAIFKDAAVANLTVTSVTCGGVGGGAACPTVPNTTVALMQGAGIVIPTLPSGGSVTFTVNARVASSATGSIANTATVTTPGGVTDPTPGNNSATDTDTLVPQVTLAIIKTDGSLNYTPGGTATYTVTVTNTGASDALDVTVTDLLPPGLTLTAAVACTANGNALCKPVTSSIGGTSFVMTNGTIGAGAGNSLVFSVPVAFAAGMTTNPLLNTATATDIATGATASDTDSDALAPQVSLAVAKTDGSATYTPGGSGTYTVTITHGGVSDATNVTVNDPLPAGVTLTANATCVPIGAATCGFVTGTTGQSVFGTTGATIAAGAGNSLVFTAPVAFAAGMSTNPLDNTATALDVLSGANGAATDSDTRAPAVTLAVTKDDSSATYTPGGGATYVVTVTNTGFSDALNVTVGDMLPIGVTLSGTVNCAPAGSSSCGIVTGSAPQTSFSAVGARINAGAANKLTFTVPVAFAASLADNPLVNTATANDLASGATGSATDSDTLAAQADLAITKTDGVTSVVPGTPTTYTIVVTNSGPSNVTGATVTDVMPAAIASDTFTATATGGATGFTASGSGNINDTVNLPVGSTITYTVVANISGSATGTVVNTATVATPPGVTDPTPGNNTATDTDTLTAQADLAITKTDGVTTVVPGTSTTYTIVVTNAGPSNVTGATVSDTMPAAITSDTFTAVATGAATGFTASGGGNINDTVNMPVGSTITYTVVAQISASATGTLVNTATVATPPGVTDPTPANNSATDTDTLSPQTDLAISKTDGVTSVMQGGSTTYVIVVTNIGPSAVTGATVSDAMPAAIVSDTFTAVASGGASGFTAAGGGNINDTVNMPVGSTITYTVVANISAGAVGTLVNTATVLTPGGVTDTNPGNNSATDTDTITLIPLADLGITKTDGSATYTPGNPIIYTIVATNAGPMGVVAATVADIVPAVITGPTWTCIGAGGGTCPASGAGNINASVNLPSGASVTFTLSGTVSPTATGNLVNTATVATPPGTTDPNLSNNSATDTDTPKSLAGLAITKTDASATYKPGFPGTYTISVTNNGPSNANSVTVTDNLPAGVSLTGNVTCVASGTATCGTITGSAGGTVFQTTGATIAVGAGNRIVFTLPVLFAANMTTNPLTNTATATDPASVSVASASDTNTLVAGPSTPIPVDNGWALALLAGFILLVFRLQSRRVPSPRRR